MTNQQPKRVLVTGVTGQDGSYMVDYLLANTPHRVYGMVRRTAKPDYGNLDAAFSNPRFTLVIGDLSDTTSIDNVVRQVKPDYFINLAAQSFVKASWDVPEMSMDLNATGVIRCLEAIQRHVPHCRFYNAGSSEEYGDVVTVPQDETHPPRARSYYGASKIAARQAVKVARESYGLYAVQGLLFNHESPRRGPEFLTRKVTLGVARIARAVKDGQPFDPIELGNLDAKRDWSHAVDFVDGIWRMLNQDEYSAHVQEVCLKLSGGRTSRFEPLPTSAPIYPFAVTGQLSEYVLSSDETHTVREFVEKAFAAAGIPGIWWNASDFNADPKDEVYLLADRDHPTLATKAAIPLVTINPEHYRPAEVALLHGTSARARAELGWSPRYTFDQLVTEMVQSDLKAVGL